ncbi:hypothetical protein Avbf_06899 [Armadillidium vulgare]|nr:hypothetical protein Avbf_06899 [Armadillidium vulgare]
MSSKPKKSRTKSKTRNSRSQNAYPGMPPGYPFAAPQFFPPQPNMGYPYQWYQPVSNIHTIHSPNVPWIPHSSSDGSPTISPKQGFPPEVSGDPSISGAPGSPDEYTVDSMRRIYNNDDGSIEIERVKVQRRQGIYDTKPSLSVLPSDSKSLVPASQFLNERRPPPRKHRRKEKNGQEVYRDSGMPIQGWYPYMPIMAQPFPYAYPYGYVWPLPPQTSISIPSHFQSPTDDSDSSASHHDNFSAAVHSPDFMQPKSRTPESQRPHSSATGSHVTESLGTDLAPSDSVSMRGFKRETSLERILRKSLEDSQNSDKSQINSQNSNDIEKTKEWMEDMQKAFESKSGFSSELTGDRSSFATAPSDIPTPPPKTKGDKNKIFTHKKSNSESNIDNDDARNIPSLPLLENTRVSESDLMYAYSKPDKREQKLRDSNEKMKRSVESDTTKPKVASDQSGRDSRTSTTSYHSTRQSGEDMLIDTDSTDIVMPLDSSTADESIDLDDDRGFDSSEGKNYKWILQSTDDLSSEGEQNTEKSDNEIIESWRTEVSMWRARLVVSLCRGEGLDQQDWGTFHHLVQHPLSLDMKLSLLHARRLCSLNYDVGVALLRNALLHLTTFGENLMKPDKERMPGWKTVTIDSNQPWVLIKGSLEILRVFGYQVRRNGTLRYRKKYSPETSVIARLTLDLLVLAEEFRLFLNGAHQYPVNITQLFTAARDSKYDKMLSINNDRDELVTENKDEASVEITLPENVEQFSGNNKKDSPETSEPSDIGENRTPTSFIPLSVDATASSQSEIESTLNKDTQTVKESDMRIENSDKECGSRETLTPTPVPQMEEKTPPGEEKECLDNSDGSGKTKRHSRKTDGKDNPEDHVYEEIGDIKDQVEDLKKSELSSQSPPPPLPPKTKSSQADDIYPQVDWSLSSSSQYSSLHDGSMSKRKKRRAPMPPSFSSDSHDTITKEDYSTVILQDKKILKEKDDSISKNPFYEERIKPAGYVGKNPFYEDLDANQNINRLDETQVESVAESEIKSAESEIKSQLTDSRDNSVVKPSFLSTSTEDLSETCSVFSLPAGVRPERKKKNKGVKNLKTLSGEGNKENNASRDVDLENSKKKDEKLKADSRLIEKYQIKEKNAERELQCDSQVVVPTKEKTEGRKEILHVQDNQKKDVIIKKIFITYDISLDDSKDLSKQKQSKDITKNETLSKNNVINEDLKKSSDSNDLQPISTGALKTVTNDDRGTILPQSATASRPNISVNKEEIPPIPPPKPALRLIDDIPYIDCNDVKSYRQSQIRNERQQPPHYGLAELIPSETTSPPASDKIEGKTSFLKLSSFVPFIDEAEFSPETTSNTPPPTPPLPPPSPPQLLSMSLPFIDSEDQETSETEIEEHRIISSNDLAEIHGSESISKETYKNQTNQVPKLQSHSSYDDESKITEKNLIVSTPKSEEEPSNAPVPVPISPPSPPTSPPPSPPPTLFTLEESSLKPESTDALNKERVLPHESQSPDRSQNTEKQNIDNVVHIHENEINENTDIVDNFKITAERNKIKELGNTETQISNIDEERSKNNLINSPDDTKSSKGLSNQTSIARIENDKFSESGIDLNDVNKNKHGNLIEEGDDDTEHKSMILFETDKENKSKILQSDNQEHEYELSEPVDVNTEERYEIPELLGCTKSSDKKISKLSTSNDVANLTSEPKDSDFQPKRPPRSLFVGKPPPLPPKPEKFFPPTLPPKTESFKSQKSTSIPSSLPSTLTKVHSSKINSGRRVEPSPLAIPDMYKSLPGNLGKASQSSSTNGTPQKRGIIRTSSDATAKGLPKSQKPSSECVSLPSSPKPHKTSFKSQQKKEKERSWPFLFCDCVHPTNSNDDIKNIIK